MNNSIIGLDIAKNIFHLVMQNGQRKKLNRNQLVKFIAHLPKQTIAMEACAAAHYWGRKFAESGHTVELYPPQYIKAYLRGQKNDYNDARAILEAAEHGKLRPVLVKSIEQQDMQTLIRMRQHLIAEQTSRANHIRGLLAEYGIVINKGIASLFKRLPEILEDATNDLTEQSRMLFQQQHHKLQELKEEVDWHSQQMKNQSQQQEICQRLQALPGVGEIVSVTLASWFGSGKQFKRGRDASAALGLVPRQHSSGGKAVLLGISKRGDSYVRSLVIHGARSVVTASANKTDTLSKWIQRLVERRGKNKATVALANKLIRIAWVIIARGECYRPAAAI